MGSPAWTDLVLMNIQMDGMNGIELMEAVFLEQPGLPFVVISAHDEFTYAQKQKCMKLGAKDYIVKPVSPEQLVEVVGKLLGNKLYPQTTLNCKYSLDGVYSTASYLFSEVMWDETFTDQDIRYKRYVPRDGISVRSSLLRNRMVLLEQPEELQKELRALFLRAIEVWKEKTRLLSIRSLRIFKPDTAIKV